jgi:cytochrome d ubiquinol oxidase subunit II
VTGETVFTLPHAVAGVMVLALNTYVLLGGADFGGGVWDLLASGPRRERQRALVADAIGPIWEANHVWLILVVVLLFSCFPRAYAHLATALHVPITLMLVGIVLRGSAFTFRTYDRQDDTVQRRWGLVFAIASVVTPVLLGVCLGAVAAGRVPMVPAAATDTLSARFVRPWIGPFPVAVGALALALFAHLAAVYLAWEAKDDALREDFRVRALLAAVAVAVTGVVTIALARADAPLVYAGLTEGHVAIAMHAVTAAAGLAGLWAVWRRRWGLARVAAAAQASFLVWGWAWSQFPWIVPPDTTIDAVAAPTVTLRLVLGALAVGTVILLPSFLYLFRVFKGRGPLFMRLDGDDAPAD